MSKNQGIEPERIGTDRFDRICQNLGVDLALCEACGFICYKPSDDQCNCGGNGVYTGECECHCDDESMPVMINTETFFGVPLKEVAVRCRGNVCATCTLHEKQEQEQK